jgi:type VI secretion system secreted protein Hcp
MLGRALGAPPAEKRNCLDRRRSHRRKSGDGRHLIGKLTDLSTPILPQTCSMGKTIPRAKFEFMRADGQGTRIKYFEIELENALIGMVAPSIRPGEILRENVCLKFSKVKWKYTQQKIGGGSGGNSAGGWDLSANKIA